jgi:hypothetical protein
MPQTALMKGAWRDFSADMLLVLAACAGLAWNRVNWS